LQNYIGFELAFFYYWEREIRLKNFNFIDPEGNVLAIQMDESNLRERKFSGLFEVVSLYKIGKMSLLTIRYLGDNFFELRIFYLDWNEIEYPIPKKSIPFPKPHKSVKFFTCFSVYLLVKLLIFFLILNHILVHICGDIF